MKLIKLSNRLETLKNLIDYGASIADIGSDHGCLPVYLAQNGYAKKIIASDISAASLKTAQQNAEKYNVADIINFIVAPGLTGIKKNDVDTIVIAGLGGETIIDILKDSPWTKNNLKLILQPQTKINLLCRFLYDNEYKIEKTFFTYDRGKRYTVIVSKN